MDLVELLPIVLVLCVGAISPGPSLVVILRNTMEGGKGRGVACGVGHGIGFGIYAMIAITGIAALKAGGYARTLEIAGGLFLLLLAGLMIGSKSEDSEHTDSERRGFVEGFMVAFLNPKILAFQMAIFSQFIQPDFTIAERLLVATIAMVIDGGWYVLVALTISGTPLLARLQANQRPFELTMAAILAAFAFWILI